MDCEGLPNANELDEYISLVANEIEYETPKEKTEEQSLGDQNQLINDLPIMRGGKSEMEKETEDSVNENALFENKAAD